MITIPPPSGERLQAGRQQARDAAASVGVNLPDVAVLALQQGRMIEAIKLIRAANPGLDLMRAKAALERMQAQARGTAMQHPPRDGGGKPAMQRQPPRPPTVAMGDSPEGLRWLLAIVVLLGVAGWWLIAA